MHRSENSNKHKYVLFLARSICCPKEITFLHVAFQESIRILFLESSGLILGLRTFGSKFSCTKFGLVPEVNTNFSWLPLQSVFFYLCFSHLEIFCFLFCGKLQSNWFFLSGSHHNRFIIPNHFHQSKWSSTSNSICCFWPGFGILQGSQYLVNLCTLGRYLQCNHFWKQNHQPECVSCSEIIFPLWQQDKFGSNKESSICNIQWKYILLTSDIPWQCYGMFLGLVNLMHFIAFSIIKAFSPQLSFPEHKSSTSFWRIHQKRWRWGLLSTLVSGT